jgi:signal peptidase II
MTDSKGKKGEKKRGKSLKLKSAWIRFIGLFTVFIGLDQASKAWALAALEGQPFVDFGFQLTHNDGIAFGLDLPHLLIHVMTVLVLGLGAWLVRSEKLWREAWHLYGVTLIAAGAIGNMIDRLLYGWVVDFIKIYFWPIFNLADVFIVVGVGILFWMLVVRDGKIEKL